MPNGAEAMRAYRARHPERVVETARRNRQRHPEVVRATQLRVKFGLTIAQYDEMLEQQGGHCALCPATSDSQGKRLAVDHCHATSKVRGLLCDRCNRALGLLADDPERMRAAALYVEAACLVGAKA